MAALFAGMGIAVVAFLAGCVFERGRTAAKKPDYFDQNGEG